METTKKQHITIIMGEFNAKVAQDKLGEHVRKYGLGNRNERERIH